MNRPTCWDEQGLPFDVVAVNHDITERKWAAAALREQCDFLQLVINRVPDLITVNDRTGRFQIVNEHAAQIYDPFRQKAIEL